MAQNAPTPASSRRSNDEGPQYMRAEAVAMRRLVAARGWWLSPQFATVPIPVLTEWEASVELAKVDHNHTTRERQQAKNLLKNRSQYQAAKRSQQTTAENVLAKVDTAPRHNGDRRRNYATPTVLDVTIKRATNPRSLDTMQARKAHRDTIEEVAQAQGKSFSGTLDSRWFQYYAPVLSLTEVSYEEALRGAEPPGSFKGKIVFVSAPTHR